MDKVSNTLLAQDYCPEHKLSVKSFLDNSIVFNEIDTGTENRFYLKYPAQKVCFNPCSKYIQLIVWTLDSKLSVLSFENSIKKAPKITFEEELDSEVTEIVFLRHANHYIFVASAGNNLILLSTQTFEDWSLTHIMTSHKDLIKVSKIDDCNLITCGTDGMLMKWSFTNEKFSPEVTSKIFIEKNLKNFDISEKILNCQNLVFLFEKKFIFCEIFDEKIEEISTISLENGEEISINTFGNAVLALDNGTYKEYRKVGDVLQLISE